MSFIVGILTVLLVFNCLLLIFLILLQLPKKDAGAGLAFGGGAADALFGAGSGNVLTKITKYATVIFFLMALFLGFLGDRLHRAGSASEFEKQLQQKQMQIPNRAGIAAAGCAVRFTTCGCAGEQFARAAGSAPAARPPGQPTRPPRRHNQNNAMAILQARPPDFLAGAFSFLAAAGCCLHHGLRLGFRLCPS